jgi:hypothetical protein
MKNSLIPKKNVIPGKNYWCTYKNYSVLYLMKYTNNNIFTFEERDISANIQEVRVMFEGYVNINKSRVPRNFLVPKRHYWCRFSDESELRLMRYKDDNSFYSISNDVFWPSNDVMVIFEDYEHKISKIEST